MNATNARLYEAMAARDSDDPDAPAIRLTLEAIRRHLGMDVAYLARFAGRDLILVEFAAGGSDAGLSEGQRLPRGHTVCGLVADAVLPQVIADAATLPPAARLRSTATHPIGAHIAVPVTTPQGERWGMLCASSIKADPSLDDRDLGLLDAFAAVIGSGVAREEAGHGQRADRLAAVLSGSEGVIALFQPIWDVARCELWGAEALCRVLAEPARGPAAWLVEAGALGRREELEIAAIRRGLDGLQQLPVELVLSLNASPATIASAAFAEALATVPPHRLLIELTERLPVADYAALRRALEPLREAGMRLAVDDAGGGYATMSHILELRPDIIKADMALTRDVDTDRARQALIAALADFAGATGATLLAKGVETAAELAALRRLGVQLAQGYLLGRPSPVTDVAHALAVAGRAFDAARIGARDGGTAGRLPALPLRAYGTGPSARLARLVV